MKKTGIVIIFTLLGCSGHENDRHLYSGRLEADIVSLSAKTAGTIDSLYVREGEKIVQGQILARINADRSLAQKRQQCAQLTELKLNLESLNAQIRQLAPQLELARETLKKIESLVDDGAATEHDRDELVTRVEVLQAQMDGLLTGKRVIASKEEQLLAGIEITDLNLKDSRILSPLNGTVINAYHQGAEVVAPGTILFDVADLSELEATIYVPLEDLGEIRLGQSASVQIDGLEDLFPGMVSWIAVEAEFTPKTILTRETRTTLVYAVKVRVSNPQGKLKIGMPVDVEM